jgi:DNA excision repair protein ERCC-8
MSVLQGHYDRVNCCVFHPNYQEMYSGSKDRQILVWTPIFDEYHDEQQVPEESDNWSDDETVK